MVVAFFVGQTDQGDGSLIRSEGIGNGYLPRNASGHQQAGYLRGCGGLYAYAQMYATD